MPQTTAILNGPVVITVNGQQISLPTSAIYFQDGLIAAKGAIYTANKTTFDALLQHLVLTGVIKQGPAAETKAVMAIQAKLPGVTGNSILLQFTKFDTSNPQKFDATLIEEDSYPGLTPSTVQHVLGAMAGSGTKPGLVYVSGAAPAATAVPAAGLYSLAVVGAATSATADIPLQAGGGNAFKVEAKAAGADGALTKVEIKNVDVAAKTFTLVASWTKLKTATAATGLAAEFAYEVDITAPSGAGSVGTPVPGSVLLSGGADAASAVSATASVSGL